MNNLKDEDIKNSIEYNWRIYLRNIYLVILIILYCISLIPAIYILNSEVQNVFDSFLMMLGIPFGIYSVSLLPSILYNQYKANYLLKNYKNMEVFEVLLDHPATSFIHKQCIYYQVSFKQGNKEVSADTNPYFDGGFLTKYSMSDYNNQKVKGLYDPSHDKFYILNK